MLTRTPMTRKTPMRRGSIERKAPAPGPKQTKPPRCKATGCRNPAIQYRAHCSPECGAVIGLAAVAKAKRAAEKKQRAEDGIKREDLKTLPDLIKEAQHAFNAYVRERDRRAGHACICCGEPLRWDVPGGAVDCGHYRSTGSASHLRFTEANAHAQRAICNRHGAGRAVDYRIGLIARIGLDAVEALESDNTPHKWTKDEVRTIRDVYRLRVRDMKRAA